jgi:hypothetical protein
MYKPEVKIENRAAIVPINIEKLQSEEVEYKGRATNIDLGLGAEAMGQFSKRYRIL